MAFHFAATARAAETCLQALWTQAREQLQVLTVICANNSYTILKVGTLPSGPRRAGCQAEILQPSWEV